MMLFIQWLYPLRDLSVNPRTMRFGDPFFHPKIIFVRDCNISAAW